MIVLPELSNFRQCFQTMIQKTFALIKAIT